MSHPADEKDDSDMAQADRQMEVAIGLRYLAIVLTGIAGIATASMKAVIVGSYVNDFGLSSTDAGFALSITMIAATSGTLLTSFLTSRTALIVALGCIVVGDVGTSLFGIGPSIFAWQSLAGIGHGFALGYMMRALPTVPNPARASGLYGVGYLALSSAGTYFLPDLQAAFGHRILFLIIGLSGVIGLAGVPWLPIGGRSAKPSSPTADAATPPASAISLGIVALVALASLVYYVSVGGYWPFVSRVADSWGIPADARLRTLGIAQLLGLCGTLFSIVVGDRLGTLRTLMSFLALQSVAIVVLLVGPHEQAVFAASAWLYVFAWLGGFPYVFSFMSRTDPSGRLNTVLIAAANAAYAIGPAGAGLIIRSAVSEAGGLAQVVLLGLILQIAGTLLILSLAFARRRGEARA